MLRLETFQVTLILLDKISFAQFEIPDNATYLNSIKVSAVHIILAMFDTCEEDPRTYSKFHEFTGVTFASLQESKQTHHHHQSKAFYHCLLDVFLVIKIILHCIHSFTIKMCGSFLKIVYIVC